MLEQSVLGKSYKAWIHSRTFALLQWVYQGLRRAVEGSVILRAIFREGWLEKAFHASLILRAINGVAAWLVRLLGHLIPPWLATAWQDSVVVRTFRGSILRELTHFEGLVCIFVFILFVVPHKSWNNLYAVAAVFVLLAFYLILTGAGLRKYRSPDLLGLGGLIFLLMLVLSMLFTVARGDSLRILLFFLASISLCYIIAADFRDPVRLRQLLGHLYAALLALSIYAVIQNVFGLVEFNSSFTDINSNGGVPGRVYATLDNPINLSEFLLLFIPLGAAFAAGAKKPWQRVLLALGLVFPIVAMVMTYARGGWIALILAVMVFTFYSNKRVLPAIFLLILLLIPFLPESVMVRLATIGSGRDTSTQHRLDIWTGVAQMLKDDNRFFAGIGLGPECFRILYPPYAVGIAKSGAYHTQMHYLELILELGVMGLLSFLYMICKYLGRAGAGIRTASRDLRLILVACVSSIAALALVGFVEYIWFYPRIMFASFIFFGVLLAAAGCAKDHAEEDAARTAQT